MISVVFPAYNEEGSVEALHKALKGVLDKIGRPYEIIAVENGSTDQTLERLKKLSPIKIVAIAKNIGQTAGLDAGLKFAKGEVIITMDADLQNDPEDIPALIAKMNEGYDVISGWRKSRQDPMERKILSRFANWLTRKVTGLYLHDHACALKAYRAAVLKGVHLYGEMHVFLPAYLFLRGAKVAEVEVHHHSRKTGLSKHNFLKAVKDISDLLTVKFLTSTIRPLLIFGGFAILSWFLAFLAGGYAIYLKIFEDLNFGRSPLPLAASLFLISGLVLFAMGFLAELLLRNYYESTGKTPYNIKEFIEK